MQKDSLTIVDNRTGSEYELPLWRNTIRAMDLRQIKVNEEDFGLMTYDPGFKNTASTKSTITVVDGAKGILRYRGYPIEQLAEKSTALEVAYLLHFGELPTSDQLETWTEEVREHSMLHEKVKHLMETFNYDAHPMGMFIATIAALSTFYPEARDVGNPDCRMYQIKRMIAKVPTIAAFSYRHNKGLPYVYPDNSRSYIGDFMNMVFNINDPTYKPHPALERAMDILFILHMDHEQNCSTTAMRTIASSLPDPYLALSGAAAGLYGPLHGGANEAVLRMLEDIGDTSNIPDFLESVKRGERRLMGFGHRVYKNYDPRARIIKKYADEVFKVTGRNPLLDIALELERIALNEDYFVSRKLYPNVDFYSGIIYQAMGLPVMMFPVMFALSRTVGWLAHWNEMMTDSEQSIARPRQVYLGAEERDYVPIDKR